MAQNLQSVFSLDRPHENQGEESRVYRTPDSAFESLPNFSYTPSYLWVDSLVSDVPHSLRMAYVDAGPRFAPVILLLHGEPTWSFLYRKMIPPLSAKFRVIAPDLIGFGRSDKLLDRKDYTYARHIRWMEQFLERLNLEQITLFCQDWGSLIGLRVAADPKFTWRFARIAVGNGGLPTGESSTEGFRRWRAYIDKLGPNDELPIGKLVAGGTAKGLSEEEVKAYNAPFPTIASQAGARAFPLLVPFSVDSSEGAFNKAALNYLSKQFIPFLLLFSDSDAITKNGEKIFENFQGAQIEQVKKLHTKIKNAAHFLQEDAPQQIVEKLIQFMQIPPAHLKKPAKL